MTAKIKFLQKIWKISLIFPIGILSNQCTQVSCGSISDYSIKYRGLPRIGTFGSENSDKPKSGKRYNFGGSLGYQDAAKLGDDISLDIAYQSTFMNVNEEKLVFHYGLRASADEVDKAKQFVQCYVKKNPRLLEDKVVLLYEPDTDIILVRETAEGFEPISEFEVDKEQ